MRHSVLNAEAFTAILFLLILFIRIRPVNRPYPDLAIPDRLLSFAVAGMTFTAFLPALGMPLIHDSYGHVYTASRESFRSLMQTFTTHPQHGDFFFRPAGYLSFWVDGKWAGFSPFRWHLWSVALHVLNSMLVFALARELGLRKVGAFVGALVFALHGSRPEAVAWVAARFDLLAAFFVLLTLLCALRFAASGNRWWFVAIAGFTTAALLSKESAFCLPLLVPGIVFLRGKSNRLVPLAAAVFLNCGLVFAYRSFLLRGIGGYGAESGSPAILHFSPIRTLNALFFRQWALLFFPVNWSIAPGAVLWFALAAVGAALLALLLGGRGSRRRLTLALAITVCAALPVQQMLLIGSDLNGARVLYLPLLGVALFWALLIQELPDWRWQAGIGGCLLLFQLAALEHNLRIWGTAARLAQESCSFVAGELAPDSSPIAAVGLPPTWHGVYFLKNSFAACVFLNSGGMLKKLPELKPDAKRAYRWSDSSNRLVRVTTETGK